MPDKPSKRDQVYADPRSQIDSFAFDESVASVFDDMIRRSVPGYGMTLSLLSVIAQHYAQPDSRIYDLGCSLGAASLAVGSKLATKDLNFICVDNASAMLDHCQANLVSLPHPIDFRCEDIQSTSIENASIVILNFTLQFVPKDERVALLRKIANGLLPGGILVLSEKIQFEDLRIQEDLTTLHHDFKRANGYSDLEISQKRAALENVLIPETLATHAARLRASGFARSEVWLQCFNFASLLAFK